MSKPRKGAGDDFLIAVDANRGWPVSEAVRFARLIEKYNASTGLRSRATGTMMGG